MRVKIAVLLALILLALSGCRFAAVETAGIRVETPTSTPRATAAPGE